MQITLERKLLVGLGSLSLALVVTSGLLGREVYRVHTRGHINLQALLDDPDAKEQVIRQLVAEGAGIWDTHNDPDVARVMQPLLRGRRFSQTEIDANRYGMRESEYELPKPKGVVRIVVLGDSFVFGHGVEPQDRLGAVLERSLVEKAPGFTGEIEVLHLAISGWDVIAECNYVRRQLSLLQPDLVVQMTCSNDLDDTFGTRGFGAMARFAPEKRARADSPVLFAYPQQFLRMKRGNMLAAGVDDESRRRFARAADEVGRLKRALSRFESRYLMVLNWGTSNSVARRLLARDLDSSEIAYLPRGFLQDESYWVSPQDSHWNPAGMQRLARFLYGLIRERGLVPALALEPWSEAREVVKALDEVGSAEASSPSDLDEWVRSRSLDDRLDMSALEQDDAAHFNGGVDLDGRVSPHASFTIRIASPGRLRLLGRCLPRPELDGASVSVTVDELPLGSFQLLSGEGIDAGWPLPAEVLGREYVTIRMEADDYVYTGEDLQHCVAFQLERLFVEP